MNDSQPIYYQWRQASKDSNRSVYSLYLDGYKQTPCRILFTDCENQHSSPMGYVVQEGGGEQCLLIAAITNSFKKDLSVTDSVCHDDCDYPCELIGVLRATGVQIGGYSIYFTISPEFERLTADQDADQEGVVSEELKGDLFKSVSIPMPVPTGIDLDKSIQNFDDLKVILNRPELFFACQQNITQCPPAIGDYQDGECPSGTVIGCPVDTPLCGSLVSICTGCPEGQYRNAFYQGSSRRVCSDASVCQLPFVAAYGHTAQYDTVCDCANSLRYQLQKPVAIKERFVVNVTGIFKEPAESPFPANYVLAPEIKAYDFFCLAYSSSCLTTDDQGIQRVGLAFNISEGESGCYYYAGNENGSITIQSKPMQHLSSIVLATSAPGVATPSPVVSLLIQSSSEGLYSLYSLGEIPSTRFADETLMTSDSVQQTSEMVDGFAVSSEQSTPVQSSSVELVTMSSGDVVVLAVSTGAVVGIIAGSVVLVGISVAVIYHLRKARLATVSRTVTQGGNGKEIADMALQSEGGADPFYEVVGGVLDNILTTDNPAYQWVKPASGP
ncbi:MAG: hypothetical protein ACR2PT_05235 [Endozoicomonas sp.]